MFWALIAVIAVVVIGVGFKMFRGRSGNFDKTGSDATMQRVQSGQMLYTAPAGAPVPGAGGVRPQSTGNMQLPGMMPPAGGPPPGAPR